MLEKLNKCPLCKSGHFLNHDKITDYAVSKENFFLCKCSNCQLLFTNPRPTQSVIAPYYNFPEYYSHAGKAQNLTQWIYQNVRAYSISKKVQYIQQFQKKGKLLDYGCGTGDFLKAAKNQGWKIAGIEPNEKARIQANLKLKNKIKLSIEEINKETKYDIITLFHVLEHIHELRTTTKNIINHLKPDGYLIVAVPNYESFDCKKYGRFWAGWDVPRHLYHFNKHAMEKFQNEFGLQLATTSPLKFDSFYVSLLSEGYKNNETALIKKYWRALTTGLKSNRSGNTSGEFSSNIFVFIKK